jgi:hypothetical protein
VVGQRFSIARGEMPFYGSSSSGTLIHQGVSKFHWAANPVSYSIGVAVSWSASGLSPVMTTRLNRIWGCSTTKGWGMADDRN